MSPRPLYSLAWLHDRHRIRLSWGVHESGSSPYPLRFGLPSRGFKQHLGPGPSLINNAQGSLATAADPDFTFVFPAGTACSFNLQIDGSGGNSHVKVFTDKNGNVIRSIGAGTGSALLFTNLDTGKTVSTKSNGAVSHTTFNPDRSLTQTL